MKLGVLCVTKKGAGLGTRLLKNNALITILVALILLVAAFSGSIVFIWVVIAESKHTVMNSQQ